eukprot:Gb_04082 [translate_table: standard]
MLATGFRSRRSSSTLAPFLSPSAMFVPPVQSNRSITRRAALCPSGTMRFSGKTRFAVEENATTAKRSAGLRFEITKLMAPFKSASLVPDMLPLTSRTVTRSIGARPLGSNTEFPDPFKPC